MKFSTVWKTFPRFFHAMEKYFPHCGKNGPFFHAMENVLAIFPHNGKTVLSWNSLSLCMRSSRVKTTKRYSAAFQRQVLDEIARGKFGSIHQAGQAYGLGMPTVYRWIRAQGREELLPKRIRIETMEERGELKESRKRIRELEAALANALMDRYLEQAFLEIACEKLQTTPEALKKKSGLTRSDVLGRKADKKP